MGKAKQEQLTIKKEKKEEQVGEWYKKTETVRKTQEKDGNEDRRLNDEEEEQCEEGCKERNKKRKTAKLYCNTNT